MLTDPRLSRLAVLVLLISTAALTRDITSAHFRHTCPPNQTRTTTTFAQ
jgi:hypothetical protein